MTHDLDDELPLELALIDAALNRLGYRTAVVPGQHELSVDIADDRSLDSHVSTRHMAVRSLHVSDQPGSGIRLLTFSTSYPFDAPEDIDDDIRVAAAEVTQYLVLGHFEVDDDLTLHLRYSTLTDAAAPLSDEVLVQLVSLLDYQQLHFGDYLEAICAGKVTLEAFADLVAQGEASGLD
jgi:hypothetical protein